MGEGTAPDRPEEAIEEGLHGCFPLIKKITERDGTRQQNLFFCIT
jgi:hypothetical protein